MSLRDTFSPDSWPDEEPSEPERIKVPCECQTDPPWRLDTCWTCNGSGRRLETDAEMEARLDDQEAYDDRLKEARTKP
jgi:hypothetical protein